MSTMGETSTLEGPDKKAAGICDRAALVQLIMDANNLFDTNRCRARHCIELAAELVRDKCALEGSKSQFPSVRGGLTAWQVRQVRAYVESNMGGKIRAADLATHVRLSKGHFARAFRASFGATPRAYILNQRMRRAEVLIRSSKAPLARIAVECGLCDQPHLSRSFRRIFGVTPNTWRREAGAVVAT